jgi:outer membrane protein assembly factor BamB
MTGTTPTELHFPLELAWTYKTGDVVHAGPAVANGTVYIGSWDRNLYALDAATGALKWRFETGDDREVYNQIGIASSAAVMDGTVFVGCRDGQFYAVDAATGTLKWKHDNNKGWTIASPSVQSGRVYFPTSDGTKFWALEASTGKPAFSVENKAISFSSPAIAGTMAFFGSSDGLLNAVDLKTGKLVAQFQTDGHKQNRSRWLDANGSHALEDRGNRFPGDA